MGLGLFDCVMVNNDSTHNYQFQNIKLGLALQPVQRVSFLRRFLYLETIDVPHAAEVAADNDVVLFPHFLLFRERGRIEAPHEAIIREKAVRLSSVRVSGHIDRHTVSLSPRGLPPAMLAAVFPGLLIIKMVAAIPVEILRSPHAHALQTGRPHMPLPRMK